MLHPTLVRLIACSKMDNTEGKRLSQIHTSCVFLCVCTPEFSRTSSRMSVKDKYSNKYRGWSERGLPLLLLLWLNAIGFSCFRGANIRHNGYIWVSGRYGMRLLVKVCFSIWEAHGQGLLLGTIVRESLDPSHRFSASRYLPYAIQCSLTTHHAL